jgi:hypothetical protein
MNLMRGIVQFMNEWKEIRQKKEQAWNVSKNKEIAELHEDNNQLQQITETLQRELRMKTKENNELWKKRITNALRERWQYWKLLKLPKASTYNEKTINDTIKQWLTQMRTHFQRKYEFTRHKTTSKQMIIMRSTQLKNHAIWQWTIKTQIKEADTTKVMSQTWSEFKNWIMNVYDERDASTKQWNRLKKIKQIGSFKIFQLQFQNAIWNMNERLNDAILNLMLMNELKPKLRSEWYMKATKSIDFHKVCRILKQLNIKIKAVC